MVSVLVKFTNNSKGMGPVTEIYNQCQNLGHLLFFPHLTHQNIK